MSYPTTAVYYWSGGIDANGYYFPPDWYYVPYTIRNDLTASDQNSFEPASDASQDLAGQIPSSNAPVQGGDLIGTESSASSLSEGISYIDNTISGVYAAIEDGLVHGGNVPAAELDKLGKMVQKSNIVLSAIQGALDAIESGKWPRELFRFAFMFGFGKYLTKFFEGSSLVGYGAGLIIADSINGLIDYYFDRLNEFGWGVGNSLSKLINGHWEDAQNWIQYGDPMVLDLDGDGIETTSINVSNATLFDLNGDGVKTGTGWVAADDGLLVMDRNGNGQIDDGRELFGDQTLLVDETRADDGFMALGDLDTNGDGKIDSSDAQFADLRVWRDLNQDGISQQDELFTLSDLGIASLSTSSEVVNQNLNGNILGSVGSYTKSDGSQGAMGSLKFASSNFYTSFTDSVEVPEALQSLPNMQGSGQVRDLKEAAALSPELASLLQAYSVATTRAEQEAILDDLLYAWSESSAMPTMTERALENGYLIQYQSITPHAQTGLMRATDLDSFASTFVYNAVSDNSYDSSVSYEQNARVAFYNGYIESQSESYQHWLDLISVLERFNGEEFIRFSPPDAATLDKFEISAIDDTSGNGATVASIFHRIQLNLWEGQLNLLQDSYDALRQSVYDGLLLQTRLKPYMEAMSLQIVDGALAIDFTGVEQLLQAEFEQSPIDGIWDSVDLSRVLGDFTVTQGWDAGEVLVEYLETHSLTEEVLTLVEEDEHFIYLTETTGGTYNAQNHDSNMVVGNVGDDVIHGFNGNDRFYGGSGDDWITDPGGDNTLNGGAGNDKLEIVGNQTITQSAHNLLIGGAGDDELYGSYSADTYVFKRGDGQDIIHDKGSDNGNVDRLVFGEGISFDDLDIWVQPGTNDLIIDIRNPEDPDATDRVTVKYGYFDSSAYFIESYELADGTTISAEEMLEIAEVRGTAGDDDIISTPFMADTIMAGAGNDTVNAGYSEDYELYGEEGNDTLSITASSQTVNNTNILSGGTGNDQLHGAHSTDIYLFDRGDGQDVVFDHGADNGNIDRLVFGEGITRDDLDIWVQPGTKDLIIDIRNPDDPGATDRVTVKYGYFDSSTYFIESYELADGTTISAEEMLEIAVVRGTAADEVINSTPFMADTIMAGAGNDTVNAGYSGDYALYGEEGNDTLSITTSYSSLTVNNTNILSGGTGNDQLHGAYSTDIYLFDRGDGQDVVFDHGADNGNVDRLVFGEGIAIEDLEVWVQAGTHDLIIDVHDPSDPTASDQVTIKYGYYSSSNYYIESYELADGTMLSAAQILELAEVRGTAGSDVISGSSLGDTIKAGDGADTLWGNVSADNRLFGEAGNDKITIKTYASSANHSNEFVGGEGNDTLTGAYGADTYVFNRGDGTDTILDSGGSYNKQDRILFGAGITADDLDIWVQPGSTNLIIDIHDPTNPDANDRIVIKNGFSTNTAYYIERVEFHDGQFLTAETLIAQAEVRGTAANDVISASQLGSPVKAGDGNDTIWGSTVANNKLYGEGGSDKITVQSYSSTANYENVFVGGEGNDTLTGAMGADTYVFNRGDGKDLVYNYYNRADNTDSLFFEAGVSADQLWFTRSGSDLVVSVIGTEDRVTIKSWYSSTNNQLDEIRTPSGVLYADQVDQLVVAMSAFAPPALGETILPEDMDAALQPVIAASWQAA